MTVLILILRVTFKQLLQMISSKWLDAERCATSPLFSRHEWEFYSIFFGLLCNSCPIGGCPFPNHNSLLEVFGMGFTPDSIDSLIVTCCISDHRISLQQHLHYGFRIDQFNASCRLFLPLSKDSVQGKDFQTGGKTLSAPSFLLFVQ